MDETTVVFAYNKSTKNTYRYTEVVTPKTPKGKIIGELYVQKSFLGIKPPTRLVVTITVPKE